MRLVRTCIAASLQACGGLRPRQYGHDYCVGLRQLSETAFLQLQGDIFEIQPRLLHVDYHFGESGRVVAELDEVSGALGQRSHLHRH